MLSCQTAIAARASWKEGTHASVQVVDVSGRAVETLDIGNRGNSSVKIEGKNMASGIYFLQLTDPAGNPIGKPVKAVLIK